MTAKEYLSQAYSIDKRISNAIKQAKELREQAERATSTLTDTHISGTRDHHKMETVIAKMIYLESEIASELARLVDLKLEIFTAIRRVDDPEMQSLLELRYIRQKTWDEIANALHHCVRWVHRLHRDAISQVGEKKSHLATSRHLVE
jgi:DNA-directed RNA polymerase specialized sigma subunit